MQATAFFALQYPGFLKNGFLMMIHRWDGTVWSAWRPEHLIPIHVLCVAEYSSNAAFLSITRNSSERLNPLVVGIY